MKLSKKHIWLISVIVVCVVAVVLSISLLYKPSRNSTSLSNYIDKHESSLMELITNYPDQYKELNGLLGIYAIDTRNSAFTRFIFPWSFDVPDDSFLYYTSNGILEISGYSFADSACVNGLGVTGKGYINCTKLNQNWFFVKTFIPT